LTDVPTLVSLNDVCRLTSLSRTAINRWRASGRFPRAVPLGDKRVAFVATEVRDWISERIAERAVGQHKAAA
jgi:predicted DNA-binding transcriptional regulator AlpA